MEDVRHYGFEVRRLDHVFARNLEAKVREKGIDELTLMHGWIIRYLIENLMILYFNAESEKISKLWKYVTLFMNGMHVFTLLKLINLPQPNFI